LKRGALLALVLAAGIVAFRHSRLDDRIVHDRFHLPAFDAYAYVAMAESPAVFTVAPWGYRVLTPLVVDALPGRDVVQGFRWVTWAGLTLAAGLTYLLLRRLGHGAPASLGGAALLAASGPVGEVVGYPYLVEPLALVLEIGFLLALEAGAGAGVLMLLSLVAASNKELQLLLLPLVYLARRDRDGERLALTKMLAAAAGALAATALLRWGWAPVASLPRLPPADSWGLIAGSLWQHRWETLRGLLLSGLLPLAAAGACLTRARPYLRRYGYLVLVTLGFPFVAWMNLGETRPLALFGRNTDRLLIFALPALLPLGLLALEALLRRPPAPTVAGGAPVRWAEPAAWALVPVVLVGLWSGLDRYRRLDLRGARDGPMVLAFCRETLRTASRVDRGDEVSFDTARRQYVWGVSPPAEMGRMRWFLRAGWGELPHYGTDPPVMRAREATLVVPCLGTRPLAMTLHLEAAHSIPVGFSINARPLHQALVGPGVTSVALSVPGELLFRGDNLLGLDGPEAAETVTLRSLSWRAAVRP
jgi:hypothetical protein